MKHPFLFLPVLAWSLVAAGTPLTLQQATEKALAANPRMRAAQLEAVAAGHRTQAAIGKHFGELSLVGSYNHYNTERPIAPIALDYLGKGLLGAPWAASQFHYGIAWTVPILASGQIMEGQRIARLSQQAAEDMALHTQQEIRYNARATFRQALTLHHARTALEALTAALEKDAADADLKVRLGSWASVDGAKVHFALESARAQRDTVVAQEQSAQALLAALMGDPPPPAAFDLQDLPQEPVVPGLEPGAATAKALGGRLDLKATQSGTSVSERRKALALEAYLPQMGITGAALRNYGPGLGNYPTNEISLNLKWTLFSGRQRVQAYHAAQADLQQAKEKQKAKELEIQGQVSEAIERIKAAQAQFAAGKAQRDLGAEVARVEHLKLEQGAGRMEDYLVGRTQELQGHTGYWQGLYALQSALDYLDFVCAQGEHHD
jgi:outer membrane protein TolC